MQKTIKDRGRKGQKGKKGQHTIAFKLNVAKDYVNGDRSQRQVAKHYGTNQTNVYKWAKRFYPELCGLPQVTNHMTEEEQKQLEELKKQNQELMKKLEFADMKATALELMIDIAEKQFGLDIRKKSGTKQP